MTPQTEPIQITIDRDALAGMNAAQRLHWLAEQAHIPETTEDGDEDDDGPLADPETRAGYDAWRQSGHRSFNMHEAEAIAAAHGQPLVYGIFCSMFAYRLNGGGGWWTKTAPDWSDDLGVGVPQFRRVQTVMTKGKLVRSRIGRCAVASYQLDFDALTALTYAHGEAMGVDFKGLAARFGGNRQTVKQTREKFHSLAETVECFDENSQTRIQGKQTLKPPVAPVDNAAQHDGSREPGEDDETQSKPIGDDSAIAESENAEQMLTAYCEANGVKHKPMVVHTHVTGQRITPAEARALIAKARTLGEPVDSWRWFETHLQLMRNQRGTDPRNTPTGGNADFTLTRRQLAALDHAQAHPPNPEDQARSMETIRAVLKPHCKALTKGNE
jgi:hypothetical protein